MNFIPLGLTHPKFEHKIRRAIQKLVGHAEVGGILGLLVQFWVTTPTVKGTMKKKIQTFKLPSGEELGEELSIEAIEFENG